MATGSHRASHKNCPQIFRDVASNVSLLSLVLEDLHDVLSQERLYFKPQLEKNARAVVSRCESIFKDVEQHTRGMKGKNFSEKISWYFKRDRVKPLRASLESLKSTLNILLHVVQLAKSTRETNTIPGISTSNWATRKERRTLVYHVIDNRIGVAKLKILEDEI